MLKAAKICNPCLLSPCLHLNFKPMRMPPPPSHIWPIVELTLSFQENEANVINWALTHTRTRWFATARVWTYVSKPHQALCR